MHHNYYFSPLVVALALSIASQTRAAEPVSLQNISFAQLKQKFTLALVKQAISPRDSLNFIREHTDLNQITHIRMQQYYAGFPVFGGYAIVHSPKPVKDLVSTSNQVMMNGLVYEGLYSELGKPSTSFLKNATAILEEFKAPYAGKELSEEYILPMVYIDNGHKAHWAYKVSLFVTYKDQIPARPTAIIEAQTHRIFVQWNDLKTKRMSVNGRGFGGNHKVGVYQYNGTGLPYLEITRDDLDELCFMENHHVKVIDMGHKYSSKIRAMKFNCPTNHTGIYWTGYRGDGYDKENGAASPTNDALYTGYVIKHMYRDWYNVEVLTKADGSPMQLIMRVHYGDGYENAYWDGRQMTFGDGDSIMYPLVSLGVGAHEVSHGFTEQHSDLEYYGQSGGINESFSDMAAQAAEYYSSGKNPWDIGSEIMKESSGYDALRYMDLPSRDGESIDSADEYYNGLDVHYSSGVYNRFFYILANKLNWNTHLAFDVMVKANMDYWTPYSTFEEAGCGVLSAASDLGYSLNDIQGALKEVAINFDMCGK
jgi:pseudolysin